MGHIWFFVNLETIEKPVDNSEKRRAHENTDKSHAPIRLQQH